MQSLNRITIAQLYKTLITLNSRLKKPSQLQFYCTAAAATTNADIIESTNGGSIVTNSVDDSDSNSNKSKSGTKKRKLRQNFYSKTNPLGNPSVNMTSLIDQWVKDGKKVRFAELQRIIRDLRKRSRYSQALQVSEWMKNSEAFTFSPIEHAVHIDLIGKVHGYVSAESYFNNLSEADKTEKTYGALLHCYVRQGETVKSLSHLQSMKEKGQLSCHAYNDIMSLYSHTGKHEKVPDVLSQMKEDGVFPDNTSYKICLNSYIKRSDIKGIEILLDEMERQPYICMDWMTCGVIANFYAKEGFIEKANDFLKRAEERLPVGDAIGYNHLISLHANLGNKSEILRLWSFEKNTCKKCLNRDYINMLNNLVRINEVEKAVEVLEEWESSGNYYDGRIPCIIIDKYIEKGQFVKAETMLKDLMEKGKLISADRWGRLAAGHLDFGNKAKAVECMKVAISLGKENNWKPEYRLLIRLLDVLGVEESTCDIDTLIDTFLSVEIEPNQVDTHQSSSSTTRLLDVLGVGESTSDVDTSSTSVEIEPNQVDAHQSSSSTTRLLDVLGVEESTSDIDTLRDTFLSDVIKPKPSQIDTHQSSNSTRLKLLGLETRLELDQVIKQKIQDTLTTTSEKTHESSTF